MKIRRDKADDLFSKLVRERAGWACETCHKYYPEGSRQGLHCSHLYSRRHKATRWYPQNAFAQCYGCHQKYGSDPLEFVRTLETIFGRKRLDELAARKESILPMSKVYKAQIVKNLQQELDRMLERRAQGERGRLEFESPY